MSTRHESDVSETEIIERPAVEPRPVVEQHVERVERVRGPVPVVPAQAVNVSTNPYAPVWTVTRVITLLFTVLEVLLLVRFALKMLGANPQQALVSGLYGITEPLVRPFQGIWPQQNTPVVFDLPALLAIVFLFLVAALVVALVRAIAGNRTAV